MLAKLKFLAASLADRCLKLLVPVSPRRVAYLSSPDFGDSAYYLFKHLVQSRRDLEHVWLVDDTLSVPAITRGFQAMQAQPQIRLRIVKKASLRGYFSYLRCRCVFYTHGLYGFSRWAWRRQVVALWHGMPIKAIAALDASTRRTTWPFGSFHLATSQRFQKIVARAFEVPLDNVKILGLPRNDALQFSDAVRYTREEVRAYLEIPDDFRLVVWLPTFRARLGQNMARENLNASFLDDLPAGMLEMLDDIAAQRNCSILVKIHPKDRLNDTETGGDFQTLKFITSPAWLQTGIQLYDLLAASDALMSDVSSVLVDYLVTDRPIGLIGFAEDSYSRTLTIPMQEFLDSPRFHALDDQTEIEGFLQAVSDKTVCSTLADEFAAGLCNRSHERSAELVAREAGL